MPSHSILFVETIALVIHGERSDCEFEALDLECLAVERVTFQNIEELESKCIFELPGAKEVFLSSAVSALYPKTNLPKDSPPPYRNSNEFTFLMLLKIN